MAYYRSSEAYDFSRFEPQNIAPARKAEPARRTVQPARKPSQPKKGAPSRRAPAPQPSRRTQSHNTSVLDSVTKQYDRECEQAVISGAFKKAALFVGVCCVLVVVLIVMQAKSDALTKEITSLESKIRVEEGECVRLNAELNSMMSADKVAAYAENVLGMVKAENYQITYLDLSQGDAIVLSGDKTVSKKKKTQTKEDKDKKDTAKTEELRAYIH